MDRPGVDRPRVVVALPEAVEAAVKAAAAVLVEVRAALEAVVRIATPVAVAQAPGDPCRRHDRAAETVHLEAREVGRHRIEVARGRVLVPHVGSALMVERLDEIPATRPVGVETTRHAVSTTVTGGRLVQVLLGRVDQARAGHGRETELGRHEERTRGEAMVRRVNAGIPVTTEIRVPPVVGETMGATSAAMAVAMSGRTTGVQMAAETAFATIAQTIRIEMIGEVTGAIAMIAVAEQNRAASADHRIEQVVRTAGNESPTKPLDRLAAPIATVGKMYVRHENHVTRLNDVRRRCARKERAWLASVRNLWRHQSMWTAGSTKGQFVKRQSLRFVARSHNDVVRVSSLPRWSKALRSLLARRNERHCFVNVC